MKKLALALSLMAFSVAHAKEIKIMDLPTFSESVSATFGLNKDLGRAWVEVTIDPSNPYSEESSDFNRVNVRGLSFDNATSTVVYDDNGYTVECGNLVRRRMTFGGDYVKKTGNCTFKTKVVKEAYDNGFEVRTVTIRTLFLDINN